MASSKDQELNPIQRSRRELTEAAELARELEAINDDELGALVTHLGLEGNRLGAYKYRRIDIYLASIGESIIARELYLEKRRFITKQLANTGLLAAAVGNNKTRPRGRPDLLSLPLVDRYAEKNPKVDRNVFADVLMANDLRWLSAPVVPRVDPRL